LKAASCIVDDKDWEEQRQSRRADSGGMKYLAEQRTSHTEAPRSA